RPEEVGAGGSRLQRAGAELARNSAPRPGTRHEDFHGRWPVHRRIAMAISNHERVGRAMDLLRQGLAPYVERELKAHVSPERMPHSLLELLKDPNVKDKPILEWDAATLLKAMWDTWNEVFRETLGPTERSLVSELRGHRNAWAHQRTFSSDDAYRALDSSHRLLLAVSSPQADDLDQMKAELLRQKYDEQSRQQRRRAAATAVSGQTGSLRPW